ncbi:MAG: hypothetical protein NTW19_19120 [Planctomycetota bacterium]|nr:hypothetical protein [Planctomycetota bacterium]
MRTIFQEDALTFEHYVLAALSLHFEADDQPRKRVPIVPTSANEGRVRIGRPVALHLRPHVVAAHHAFPSGVRHPFAILLSVNGCNALTGEPASELGQQPQNYFVSPPQGAIDGYWSAGKLCPFGGEELAPGQELRLDIRVLPMKQDQFDHLANRMQLVPGPGPAIGRGTTLAHGGERACEPVYEDLGMVGNWDKGLAESIVIRLHR